MEREKSLNFWFDEPNECFKFVFEFRSKQKWKKICSFLLLHKRFELFLVVPLLLLLLIFEIKVWQNFLKSILNGGKIKYRLLVCNVSAKREWSIFKKNTITAKTKANTVHCISVQNLILCSVQIHLLSLLQQKEYNLYSIRFVLAWVSSVHRTFIISCAYYRHYSVGNT